MKPSPFHNLCATLSITGMLLLSVCSTQQALAGCTQCTCDYCICGPGRECMQGSQQSQPQWQPQPQSQPQSQPEPYNKTWENETKQQVQETVQRHMKDELEHLSDTIGRPVSEPRSGAGAGAGLNITPSLTGGASSLASPPSSAPGAPSGSLSFPSGFPPSLIDRMNRLPTAETISPQQKQVIQQRFEDMKAEYEAISKIQSPTKAGATATGQPRTAAERAASVEATSKRVEDWMKSPSVTQFLSDTDAMLHRQGKLEYFTRGRTAIEQAGAVQSGSSPKGSEFDIRQPGGPKPAGTPFFRTGGGDDNAPTSTSGQQQDWNKPKVQMPSSYRRKPTVPPVPRSNSQTE